MGIRRPKIYYGWVIVAVAGLASFAQTAYYGPVFGSFLKPITQDFGWSRAQYVGASSLGGVIGGVASFFIGPILDRYGPRWPMLIGASMIGSALILTPHVQNLAEFYALTIAAQVGSQSMIGLAIQTVVPKWFVRKRGRAQAFSNIGTRIGVGLNPLWVQFAIVAFSWRFAITTFAAVTLSLTLIPIYLFMRRQPEDMGLQPDGDEFNNQIESTSGNKVKLAAMERSFTRHEVLRQKSFYFLVLSFVVASFSAGGININLIPMLTDNGLSQSHAAMVVTAWSSIGLIGTLGAGFLVERIQVKYMAAAVYTVLAVGLLILSQVHDLTMALLFAVVHGVAWGAWNNIQVQIFADFYGRKSIGSIRGLVAPLTTITSALAPVTIAYVFDTTGSYTVVLTVFMVTMLFAAFMMTMLRSPQISLSKAR